MTSTVEELTADSITQWRRGENCFPSLGRQFTPAQQAQKEALLDRFLGSLEGEMAGGLRTGQERARVHARITAAFAEFARAALELEDCHIALLLDRGFSSVGTSLGREARRFDPRVSTAEILQACRNAWAACGLQALFGLPMTLTPAIFAYSMLYPYSDNYLDDACIPREQKLSFSARFRRWLAGEDLPAMNSREETIRKLVSMIESGYGRNEYPEVYTSLLAIHRSQEDSLRMLESGTREDVLPLVFAKGGSSVLADAYLAAGQLTNAEASFAFDWGVLLQLGDDLQDVREDSANGLRTVFSSAISADPRSTLDALTNRTLQFALQVMTRMDGLNHSSQASPQALAPQALQDLLRRSSISLVVKAAGALPEYYSPGYIAQLEACSPFRFGFLKSRREKLARHKGRLAAMFEAFLAAGDGEPIFPLIPGSLFL